MGDIVNTNTGEKLSHVEGSWLSHIDFDGQRYTTGSSLLLATLLLNTQTTSSPLPLDTGTWKKQLLAVLRQLMTHFLPIVAIVMICKPSWLANQRKLKGKQ